MEHGHKQAYQIGDKVKIWALDEILEGEVTDVFVDNDADDPLIYLVDVIGEEDYDLYVAETKAQSPLWYIIEKI